MTPYLFSGHVHHDATEWLSHPDVASVNVRILQRGDDMEFTEFLLITQTESSGNTRGNPVVTATLPLNSDDSGMPAPTVFRAEVIARDADGNSNRDQLQALSFEQEFTLDLAEDVPLAATVAHVLYYAHAGATVQPQTAQ